RRASMRAKWISELDVLVELEGLLVVLFGQLEPDEEAGEDDKRDDEDGAEGDAQRDGDGLESFHGGCLQFDQPCGGWVARRSDGALAIMSAMSSLVNSMRSWRSPPVALMVIREMYEPSTSKKKMSRGCCSSRYRPMTRSCCS